MCIYSLENNPFFKYFSYGGGGEIKAPQKTVPKSHFVADTYKLKPKLPIIK